MATATQPKPKPTTSGEALFLEQLCSLTGGSKAAVLDALSARADQIGKLVRQHLEQQSTKRGEPMPMSRAGIADRLRRLEQNATERAFPLGRVVAGAKTLADVMSVASVPDAALRQLEPHERTMLHALSIGNKAGRALALVLATHRGMELPPDDPMAAKVAANRRVYALNVKRGAVARAVREKNGK